MRALEWLAEQAERGGVLRKLQLCDVVERGVPWARRSAEAVAARPQRAVLSEFAVHGLLMGDVHRSPRCKSPEVLRALPPLHDD